MVGVARAYSVGRPTLVFEPVASVILLFCDAVFVFVFVLLCCAVWGSFSRSCREGGACWCWCWWQWRCWWSSRGAEAEAPAVHTTEATAEATAEATTTEATAEASTADGLATAQGGGRGHFVWLLLPCGVFAPPAEATAVVRRWHTPARRRGGGGGRRRLGAG